MKRAEREEGKRIPGIAAYLEIKEAQAKGFETPRLGEYTYVPSAPTPEPPPPSIIPTAKPTDITIKPTGYVVPEHMAQLGWMGMGPPGFFPIKIPRQIMTTEELHEATKEEAAEVGLIFTEFEAERRSKKFAEDVQKFAEKEAEKYYGKYERGEITYLEYTRAIDELNRELGKIPLEWQTEAMRVQARFVEAEEKRAKGGIMGWISGPSPVVGLVSEAEMSRVAERGPLYSLFAMGRDIFTLWAGGKVITIGGKLVMPAVKIYTGAGATFLKTKVMPAITTIIPPPAKGRIFVAPTMLRTSIGLMTGTLTKAIPSKTLAKEMRIDLIGQRITTAGVAVPSGKPQIFPSQLVKVPPTQMIYQVQRLPSGVFRETIAGKFIEPRVAYYGISRAYAPLMEAFGRPGLQLGRVYGAKEMPLGRAFLVSKRIGGLSIKAERISSPGYALTVKYITGRRVGLIPPQAESLLGKKLTVKAERLFKKDVITLRYTQPGRIPLVLKYAAPSRAKGVGLLQKMPLGKKQVSILRDISGQATILEPPRLKQPSMVLGRYYIPSGERPDIYFPIWAKTRMPQLSKALVKVAPMIAAAPAAGILPKAKAITKVGLKPAQLPLITPAVIKIPRQVLVVGVGVAQLQSLALAQPLPQIQISTLKTPTIGPPVKLFAPGEKKEEISQLFGVRRLGRGLRIYPIRDILREFGVYGKRRRK